MELRRGLACLTLLCLFALASGQGDFDLADALDDPEPTKKPSSDGQPRPKPPAFHPQPGNPSHGGSIYPRIKPQPLPQPGDKDIHGGGGHWNNADEGYQPPRPKPPAAGGTGGTGGTGGAGGGGGGSGSGSYNSYGNTHGGRGSGPKPRPGNSHGGAETSSYDSPQGNTIARIVSPIVSVVVVALLGAGVSFFKSNRRGNCLRASDAVDV